ncbi:hypothetical protein BST34_09405 [Mycolicibacterium monacense DSM 44395]|uniref:Uncharacterized protein n=2 Tax=unclassified Mycobacterium TaxID=2642494 RepID=A0A5Q5BRP7_MYCSS|nr:hypothetical protein BST34_09405 [Mycolicibacterium monacense DSM 44395]QHP88551.1 hypothetical protein EWR22_26115 [Mycolicibacterium monacense DSM 44395]
MWPKSAMGRLLGRWPIRAAASAHFAARPHSYRSRTVERCPSPCESKHHRARIRCTAAGCIQLVLSIRVRQSILVGVQSVS